jgi:hypothetical protein
VVAKFGGQRRAYVSTSPDKQKKAEQPQEQPSNQSRTTKRENSPLVHRIKGILTKNQYLCGEFNQLWQKN